MKHKILIIDDHPETLSIIERVLTQHGYYVVGARSGSRGLALAEVEMPDLVLLDGMMPEMDGWEVCRRLRANPHLSHVPIIMFSAGEQAEQKLAGFEAGADDYLTKPTEPEELISRVKAMLQPAVSSSSADDDQAKLLALNATVDPAQTEASLRTPLPPSKTTSLPPRKNVIAVLGARGGAGTTTIAINLAAALAARDISTTLVDLDLIQGHVALYLKQKVTGGVNELAGLPADAFKPEATAHIVPYSRNMQLLLARSNLLAQHPTLSPPQMTDLVRAVARPGECIVLDLGSGVPAMPLQGIFEQATQALICLSPERVALAAARKLLSRWQQTSLPSGVPLKAVMLDFTGGREAPKRAIEQFLGHPLLATLPVSVQELTQAVSKGVPLVQLFPQSQTAVSFQRLAQRLTAAQLEMDAH